MRVRAGASSAAIWMAVIVMACSVSPLLTPSPAASIPPTVAAATPTVSAAPTADIPWVERTVPETTTAGGADLASTVAGDKLFIHAVVSNIEEAFEGGWDGSVYLRTPDEGKAWGERLLIEGIFPRIAAAGADVYVAFQAYRCGGVGVLRNSDHGRRGAWLPLKCVTRSPELNSEWSPVIAATGRLVYVASVDERTRRAGVRISHDRGRTWAPVDLGPARGDRSDIVGPVSVAATGPLVAVAWTDRGATFARVSIDASAHWGNAAPLPEGASSAAAGDSRLAFGGMASDGSPAVSIWTETEAWRALAVPQARMTPPSAYQGATVALGPAPSLALTYVASCPVDAPLPEGDTRWTTSPDGGATWKAMPSLPRCASFPAMVWAADGRAFLLFHGGEDSYVLAVHP